MLRIKWCGIDFGQTLMEASSMRNHLVIGDICKIMGNTERMPETIKRFRQTVEAFQGYDNFKENYRDQIGSYVFAGYHRGLELFDEKELEYMGVSQGASELLLCLKERGIDINIVSELKKTPETIGENVITKFLKMKGLIELFNCLYTPLGKIDLRNGQVDKSYLGKTKKSGQLFEKIIEEVRKKGINSSEMLMIGDKVKTDINPAAERGMKTIQYTGYTDTGLSKADFRVKNLMEIISFIA